MEDMAVKVDGPMGLHGMTTVMIQEGTVVQEEPVESISYINWFVRIRSADSRAPSTHA